MIRKAFQPKPASVGIRHILLANSAFSLYNEALRVYYVLYIGGIRHFYPFRRSSMNKFRHLSDGHKHYGPLALFLIQVFFSTFALCNICGLSPSGILSVIVFGLLVSFFSYQKKKTAAAVLPRNFSWMCTLLAALYMVFYMASEHKKLTGGFESRMFRFSFVLVTAIGLFFLFNACCRLLMVLFSAAGPASFSKGLSRRQKGLIFAGLLLCWLPWFLYNYPGVMTPDSLSQFSQATGLIPYSSHHSILHTLIFSFFYHIGFALTHQVNAGIAFYIVFQMLTLAAVETCCLSLLAQKGVKKWMLTVWFLFWGLVPYHGIYAVTMWKDVLFSAFVLLYAIVLYRLLELPDLSFKKDAGLLSLLFLSGWFTCMLRSNGLYIFVFTLPFVCFVFRRRIRIMGTIQLAVLLLALVVQGPVMDHFGVKKPHFTESLSIPLQQVARVVKEGRELTADQKELINQVVDISLIPDYYNPSLSDPIKALVIYNNADYLAANKSRFFRLWLELGLQYPRDYMEAFIDQTRGYWYPAPADMRTNEGISPNEIGLSWPHVLRGLLPVKISELLLKMPDLFPLYGLLWSIGAFTWAALFLTAFQFLYGDRRYLILYLPFVGTVLTLLLATPVASDIRYAYPLFLGMPFLLSVPVLTKRYCIPEQKRVK